MWEFFKPWRRKIGVATLVMACVFAGGWARSTVIRDWVNLRRDNQTMNHFGSNLGRLLWMGNRENRPMETKGYKRHLTLKVGKVDFFAGEEKTVHWHWNSCGFEFGKVTNGVQHVMLIWIIPYWSVTIPLTMLSAYLLLSKPQSRQTQVDPDLQKGGVIMGGYFRPLRRKLGVLTLVMACVFAAGWVRSLSLTDPLWSDWSSAQGLITFSKELFRGHWIRRKTVDDLWEVVEEFGPLTADEIDCADWKKNGTRDYPLVSWQRTLAGKRIIVAIPYWSIVAPLTLLSAWLLLSKPRQRQTIVDPLTDKAA